MLRKFASIAHSTQLGYAFDSDAYSSNAPIHCYFRAFHTYGDGLIQHSGDWAITSEYFSDYLASLTVAMLEDAELTDSVLFPIHRGPTLEQIQFAASIVWKESDKQYTKRRYFSLSEQKVSASQSKEHDKRYARIEDWHDGSAESIFRILTPAYADGLDLFCIAEKLYAFTEGHPKLFMQLPGKFLKWTDDAQKAVRLQRNFAACKAVAESARLRHFAKNAIEHYHLDLDRDAKAKAEAERVVATVAPAAHEEKVAD